jgi:GNAT superfamily N-acetyltransferase
MLARWGGEPVVSRGRLHTPSSLPGFIAEGDGERLGLATYHIEARGCEIVSLDSLREREGIGTSLVEAVKREAAAMGCDRVWLVTTNDNIDALAFYQRRGFRFCAVHPGAVDEARKLKPTIPDFAGNGIPIQDEIELAWRPPAG